MKKFLLIIVASITLACGGDSGGSSAISKIDCGNGTQDHTVVFIGNSLTYYNDLPQIFKEIADKDNKKMAVSYYTIGGTTLAEHYNNPAARNIVNTCKPDILILQDQSETAETAPVQKWIDLAKSNNAGVEVILYQSWVENCPLVKNKFSTAIASLTVAPVGYAFNYYASNTCSCPNPSTVDFWIPDSTLTKAKDYHPTEKGSYLAAMSIYESIPGFTLPAAAPASAPASVITDWGTKYLPATTCTLP